MVVMACAKYSSRLRHDALCKRHSLGHFFVRWNRTFFLIIFEILKETRDKTMKKLQTPSRRSTIGRNTQRGGPISTLQIRKLARKLKGITAGQLFSNMDADRSNSVTSREFQLGLKSVGIHLLDIDVARVFKGIDANHNGRISIDELRVALFPRERVRVTPHRRRRSSFREETSSSSRCIEIESFHCWFEKGERFDQASTCCYFGHGRRGG